MATSGGDHGGPFVLPGADEGVDETGEEKLDVGMLDDPEDPTQWEYDSTSGIYYRSPTDDEMAAYNWTRYHLLVLPNQSAFLNNVLGHASTATVALPIHDNAQNRPQRDLDIATVSLAQQYSHNAIPYAEKRISASGTYSRWTGYPTLSLYLPFGIAWNDVPDRMVAVMSSSRGGLELHGGTDTEQFWMRGPYVDGVHVDLDIAPPVGTAFYLHHTKHDHIYQALTLGRALPGDVAQKVRDGRPGELAAESRPHGDLTPIGQCVDGLDNDPDEYADDCDYNCVQHNDFGGDDWAHRAQFEYSKDFALLGDVEFCSPSQAMGVPDPLATMALLGEEASGILNGVQPPSPYEPDPRAPPFRLTVCLCSFVWEGATQAQVDACHEDEEDCPAAILGDYPLGGTGYVPASIYNKAWEFLDASINAQSSTQRRPVHIAAVITGRPIGANGATEGWTNNIATNGALVIQDESTNTGGVGGTLAHEIGHTMGLAHDGATWPGSNAGGFMNDGFSQTPILDWDAPSDICDDPEDPETCSDQGAVWKNQVPSKFHPRRVASLGRGALAQRTARPVIRGSSAAQPTASCAGRSDHDRTNTYPPRHRRRAPGGLSGRDELPSASRGRMLRQPAAGRARSDSGSDEGTLLQLDGEHAARSAGGLCLHAPRERARAQRGRAVRPLRRGTPRRAASRGDRAEDESGLAQLRQNGAE